MGISHKLDFYEQKDFWWWGDIFYLKAVTEWPFMISYLEVYTGLFPAKVFEASYHVDFKLLRPILNGLNAWLVENNHPS